MVIDRIEGNVAVVEVDKGTFMDVPLSRIDGHARDGATLVKRCDRFVVDEGETAKRNEAVREKRGRLFR